MQTVTSSITVVIADDHEVTRVGIRTILQKASDIAIVGEAIDGTGARRIHIQQLPLVGVVL